MKGYAEITRLIILLLKFMPKAVALALSGISIVFGNEGFKESEYLFPGEPSKVTLGEALLF